MQGLIKENRAQIRYNDNQIKVFKNSVYHVVQFIDDYEVLKREFYDKFKDFTQNQNGRNVDIDPDIKKEYEN